MSMNGNYGDYVKVKFISEIPNTGFRKDEIYDATFLRKDPQGKWYIIKDSQGEEYAYPRDWFELQTF